MLVVSLLLGGRISVLVRSVSSPWVMLGASGSSFSDRTTVAGGTAQLA